MLQHCKRLVQELCLRPMTMRSHDQADNHVGAHRQGRHSRETRAIYVRNCRGGGAAEVLWGACARVREAEGPQGALGSVLGLSRPAGPLGFRLHHARHSAFGVLI